MLFTCLDRCSDALGGEGFARFGPPCRSNFGRRHRRSQVGFWPRSRFASGFAESGPGPVPLYVDKGGVVGGYRKGTRGGSPLSPRSEKAAEKRESPPRPC